jgi:glutamyl-tRNA reductase
MTAGNWHLIVCGISHKSSTLEQRAPLQIGHDEMARANALFSELAGVKESAVVSTCNRVEFYFVSDKGRAPLEIVIEFYQKFKDLDLGPTQDCFYTKRNRHVADHLCRVVAGIDSMVLGENQILGQTKDAYSSACAVRSAGKVLHRLFHQAFRVGKQVRTDTEMGRGACSVSSAAVDMLKTKVRELQSASIMFVGANQMIKLAASNLSKFEHDRFVFVNRTPEKAEAMALRHKAEWFGLDALPQLLTEVDIIISCTGATEPVITRKMIDEAIEQTPDRRLVIIDLAIPRDVEFESGEHKRVDIADLEIIREFVKTQQDRRQRAIPEAEEMIDRQLGEFVYWIEHVKYESLYNGLDDSFESVRMQEMLPLLSKLPEDLRREVDETTRQMVDRLLQMKTRNIEDSTS